MATTKVMAKFKFAKKKTSVDGNDYLKVDLKTADGLKLIFNVSRTPENINVIESMEQDMDKDIEVIIDKDNIQTGKFKVEGKGLVNFQYLVLPRTEVSKLGFEIESIASRL